MRSVGMPRAAAAVLLALALVAVGVFGLVTFVGGDGTGTTPSVAPSPVEPTPTTPASPPVTGEPGGSVDADLARAIDTMSSMPDYAGPTPLPPIAGPATKQADLYAAEFVRRLLSRDYAKTSRREHLTWVQAESARTTEPLVIGLVPEHARDRFAVWSVTDTSVGQAPVPTEDEWGKLAKDHAVDKAKIQRVTQPVAWTNAVAAGRITDPGITARQVSATVTRSSDAGKQRFSVALSLNLEGPPTQSTWGVVGVITYTSIPVGEP